MYAAGGGTFSMLAICALLILVKFAPTRSLSVPPLPSSSVSFWAPIIVSAPEPPVMLSTPDDPVITKPSV